MTWRILIQSHDSMLLVTGAHNRFQSWMREWGTAPCKYEAPVIYCPLHSWCFAVLAIINVIILGAAWATTSFKPRLPSSCLRCKVSKWQVPPFVISPQSIATVLLKGWCFTFPEIWNSITWDLEVPVLNTYIYSFYKFLNFIYWFLQFLCFWHDIFSRSSNCGCSAEKLIWIP